MRFATLTAIEKSATEVDMQGEASNCRRTRAHGIHIGGNIQYSTVIWYKGELFQPKTAPLRRRTQRLRSLVLMKTVGC